MPGSGILGALLSGIGVLWAIVAILFIVAGETSIGLMFVSITGAFVTLGMFFVVLGSMSSR